MFASIVVGTDGSPDATAAVKMAGHLACLAPEGVVHVVNAYEALTPAELSRLDRELPDEFRDQLTGDLLARASLDPASSLLAARGVEHTAREMRMHPADAILRRAEEVEADMIVVGSRGEGAIDRLRHGSTSTRVLHEAPCSVLVVRP